MAAGGLATVDAAGHAYPAAQSPLHVATPTPLAPPYLPVQHTHHIQRTNTALKHAYHMLNLSCACRLVGQTSSHTFDVDTSKGSSQTQPPLPAGQLMHTLAPTKLYRPTGQMFPAALDTVDAAGHAYPAAQSPLHVATDTPGVLPNLPATTNPHNNSDVNFFCSFSQWPAPRASLARQPTPAASTDS